MKKVSLTSNQEKSISISRKKDIDHSSTYPLTNSRSVTLFTLEDTASTLGNKNRNVASVFLNFRPQAGLDWTAL